MRCFDVEIELTDDVDFAAFALKHNFRENKGKIKSKWVYLTTKIFIP